MSGGIELVADSAAEAAREAHIQVYDSLVEQGMSPIEALFILTLGSLVVFEVPLRPRRDLRLRFCKLDGRVPTFPPYVFEVVGQARLLDWPVDFLISICDRSGTKYGAVVECDGHEFHERTKEQAAKDRSRDRRLQASGFRVFRFTGSEIHNNPAEVAGEILLWAKSVWEPA